MSALSFELDGVTVLANDTKEVLALLNEGYESDYIGNDQVLAYINNEYPFEFYSQALQDEILYSEIPEWLKDEKTDYSYFKELFEEYNFEEMGKLIDSGLSIEEAKELQDDGINFDDIPEFLQKDLLRLSAYDVKEWMKCIENNNYNKHVEEIAEAAYNLDISPNDVFDYYIGYDLDASKYGQEFYDECYDLKNIPGNLQNYIDWESYGQELLSDFAEYNNYYYFNNN